MYEAGSCRSGWKRKRPERQGGLPPLVQGGSRAPEIDGARVRGGAVARQFAHRRRSSKRRRRTARAGSRRPRRRTDIGVGREFVRKNRGGPGPGWSRAKLAALRWSGDVRIDRNGVAMENDLAVIASGVERHVSWPRYRAEDLVDEAWESAGRRHAVLARRALALWPDCADGYVLLAQAASSLEEARGLLERALAAGRARGGSGCPTRQQSRRRRRRRTPPEPSRAPH